MWWSSCRPPVVTVGIDTVMLVAFCDANARLESIARPVCAGCRFDHQTRRDCMAPNVEGISLVAANTCEGKGDQLGIRSQVLLTGWTTCEQNTHFERFTRATHAYFSRMHVAQGLRCIVSCLSSNTIHLIHVSWHVLIIFFTILHPFPTFAPSPMTTLSLLFGRLDEQSPLAGYVPKTLIEVSSEQTPVNLFLEEVVSTRTSTTPDDPVTTVDASEITDTTEAG